MDDKIDRLIDGILDAEGWPKFINDPNDRGGPTKGGITLKTLGAWRGKPVSAADVEALTGPEVRAIYRQEYVVGPGLDGIVDAALRFFVVDAAVLHGQGWAARRLQEVAGVAADGVVGPVTLAAVNAEDIGAKLNLLFAARRVRKVADIAVKDPSQLKWLRGWINRSLKAVEHEAEFMF